jgi:hypothetical protein
MIGAGCHHDGSRRSVFAQQSNDRADRGQSIVSSLFQEDSVALDTGFHEQARHDGGLRRPVPSDRSGWDEARVRVSRRGGKRGFDPSAKGYTGLSIRPDGGTENKDREHPVIRCQISHRKQSGRRYNTVVLCGAALGVELVQGIGLNPRGTHMRLVSTRWSLSAAGLISALALAACSQPAPPPPPPAPAPVVTTAPPMVAPTVTHTWRHHKHSKAWYRRHHRTAKKHRKM